MMSKEVSGKHRIRGYNDSSIVVSQTDNGVKVEILVKGGKTYCHLSEEKALEFGQILCEHFNKKDQ